MLGELNHRKKHLQRVEQTTSPTLRRSVGGSVISDGEDSVFLDNKENAQNTSNDRTLTTSNVSETPVKTPTDQEIQNPPKVHCFFFGGGGPQNSFSPAALVMIHLLRLLWTIDSVVPRIPNPPSQVRKPDVASDPQRCPWTI